MDANGKGVEFDKYNSLIVQVNASFFPFILSTCISTHSYMHHYRFLLYSKNKCLTFFRWVTLTCRPRRRMRRNLITITY
ncbi:unnamed protein product [Sympodiomycopsis kandeliae]